MCLYFSFDTLLWFSASGIQQRTEEGADSEPSECGGGEAVVWSRVYSMR